MFAFYNTYLLLWAAIVAVIVCGDIYTWLDITVDEKTSPLDE